MYSPTTRLLTVLELLQSYKHMSGAEIARRLEVDVRTVRRYIMNLQDMGIPVEAERGPYGAYQLMRGHRLPPLMFSDAEAVAITLSLLAIREYQFPVDVAAVEGALAKTERVLPEKLLLQVRALQEAITFNVERSPAPPLSVDFVTPLSLAVQQRQRVRLGYQAWGGSESEREFDPYGVVFHMGYWYTTGYCHLREGLRTFRLDRVTTIEPLTQTFERPQDFNALAYVLGSIATMPGSRRVRVLWKTTMEQARQSFSPEAGLLELTEDGVMFYREAYELEWIPYFLLSLPFPVVVLEPPELQEMMREIGRRAFRMAGDETT